MILCVSAHARTLHVGDNIIKLSPVKTTDPALHVRVDNEVWYGMMCTNFKQDSLHIKYNGTVYDVTPPFADTTNYTYDENGRLIGANENVFLQNQPKKYMPIDTGIPGNNDNLSFELRYKWIVLPARNIYIGLFGNYPAAGMQAEEYNVTRFLFYNNEFYVNINTRAANSNSCQHTNTTNEIYTAQFSKTKRNINMEQLTCGYSNITGLENTTNIFLFVHNNKNLIDFSNKNAIFAIYHFKIWDNDVLVRHFVPVPCGLQIGDFIVPSNGMWDIVEQKFYGNMGTGDFIYGVDE